MGSQDFEELFGEGWREPDDDCQRLMVYFVLALGLLLGAALIPYSIWGFFHPSEFVGRKAEQATTGADYFLCFLALAVGAAFIAGPSVFLYRESRSWDLKNLTAEKFIAGGFLMGFAIMLLSVEFLSYGQGGILSTALAVGTGAAVLVLFLAIGLIFALASEVKIARTIPHAVVVDKYAVDDAKNQVYGHPCPWADAMVPIIVLELPNRSSRRLIASRDNYEFLEPGMTGAATVRDETLVGWRHQRFRSL